MEVLDRLRCNTLQNEKLKETERVLLNTFDMMKKYVDGEREENDQLPFKCNKCTFECNSDELLTKHISEKHKKTSNDKKCDQCDYICSTSDSLSDHKKRKHEIVITCEFCSFTCLMAVDMKKHLSNEHCLDIFSCNECKFVSHKRHELLEHMRSKHKKKTDLKETTYNCDKCSMKCKYKNTLKEHKQACHGQTLVYLCSICEFESLSKTELKTHAKKEHKDDSSTNMKDMGPSSNKVSCNPADSSHSSDCCDRIPGQRRPTLYSPDEKAQNGYCVFWNNGYCRYEDLCWKMHEEIPGCYYGTQCKRHNCSYYHEDISMNSFLGLRTKSQFRYQEEDFPPLAPSQGRRH